MSLDVTIIYKQPKKVNYNKTHSACGSTIAIFPDEHEETLTEWSANITHNMGNMASNIPTHYFIDGKLHADDLYHVVWRPDEKSIGNTSIVKEGLINGIVYMLHHRKELLQYNPENGWGDYDSFLSWLIDYKNQCEDNPDCQILISR